jgi:hypothetical protein
MAVVLYDSEMQRGSTLGPLSLLMKGETLAPHGRWHGIPSMPVGAAPIQSLLPLRPDPAASSDPVSVAECAA